MAVTFRWRIRQKLSAGLLLVVGMTVLFSAGAFYGLYSHRHNNKTFYYFHQQLERLSYLVLAVAEMHYPDPVTFNPDADPSEVKAAKLERLARVEKTLRLYRRGLEDAVEGAFTQSGAQQQFAELDRMLGIIAALQGSLNGAPRALANTSTFRWSWWHVGDPRDNCIKLTNALSSLRGHIHREIIENVESDRANYRTSMAIVYSASFLVLVMMVVLVWLGYRSIFYPIRALHRGVVKLASGNFDSRVAVGTGDELQELAESFNEMSDRLAGIYRDLNRQVEERSRQLIRSERLASVGFLAAGVAHEINNPLASIAFCGEALESRLKQLMPEAGRDAEVVRNYLNMIQQEAFRCKAITEKLLNFSRVGAPERIETDLVALIREVLEMIQHLGRAKGKNLTFQPNQTVFCSVNPQELKQVLLNLIVNGLESVDDGGTVEVIARNTEGNVELAVRDNGCGMTAEVLENLFEPFFTRNRTGKGTGLGLSISHLIVSQHAGTLEAASPGPGKGSVFVVRLPLRPAAAAPLARAA